MVSERERARRMAVVVDVALEAGDAYYFLETCNMSETGLFLRTKKSFPVGTYLRMVFGRPPKLPRVNAEGVVRWSKAGEGVGVEFMSLTSEDKQTLAGFLNSSC